MENWMSTAASRSGMRFRVLCCALAAALSLSACAGASDEADGAKALATLVPAAGVEVEDLLPEYFEEARLALEARCKAIGLSAEVSYDAEKVCYSVRAASESEAVPAEFLAQLNRTASFSVTEDNAGQTVLLDEADLEAVSLVENGGRYQLNLTLTDEAKARWAEATRRLVGQETYVWLDHALFARPVISAEVTDGSLVLSPFSTGSQAAGMAAALAAPLPFRLEITLSES